MTQASSSPYSAVDLSIPVARPLGSHPSDASRLVSQVSGETAATNTPPQSSSPVGGRIGRRQLERLAAGLSDRDRLVLARIWEHRYLTTGQLQALVFTGHTSGESAGRTARRVLARLSRQQLIRPLARRVGGVRAGSEARVWQLAPAGVRLITPDRSRNWRTHLPSERFLAHCLAVADVHLELRRGLEQNMIVSVQIEPVSWRRFTGLGGEARLVRPDLAARIGGQDDQGAYEDGWFIEVDMGTESMPTLLAKCQLYQDYFESGTEQAAHGSFPRVLWILHGERRHQRAQTLISRILRTPRLHPQVFAVVTVDALPSVLWESIEDSGASESNQSAPSEIER